MPGQRPFASLLEDKIYGCLLAGMIGDAMGAPVETWDYPKIIEQYGPQGITDFEGVGTDDTLIREQLIDAIIVNDGHVTCDEFAESFIKFRETNFRKWWTPVRNMFHKVDSKVTLPVDAGWGNMHSTSSAMAPRGPVPCMESHASSSGINAASSANHTRAGCGTHSSKSRPERARCRSSPTASPSTISTR